MRVLAGFFGMFLLLVFLATSSNAMQLMMVVEEQSPDGKTTGSHKIYADKNHGISMESKDGGDHGGITWNKEKMIAWVMNFVEGTYWTMTEEDAAKVKKMRQQVMPKMSAHQQKMKELFEQQMKGKSEEEKKMMRKHAPLGMGMGPEEEEIDCKEAGTEVLNPWGNTRVYICLQDGEMVEKVWTVGWDQLGVDESYLKVFGEFGEFAGGAMGGEGDDQLFDFAQAEEEQGYSGFAVRRERYDDFVKLKSVEITKSVELQETDLSRYQLPTTDPPLEETGGPFDEMPTGMPGMPPGF